MKEETLKRLLSLIEKTGDRLVITDPSGEHPYVLMGLDHYEKLVVGEWKPEVLKRDPAPPQALPISTGFPDNKPPKREIPLWKASPEPGSAAIPPGPRLAQDRPRFDEKLPESRSNPAPAPRSTEPKPAIGFTGASAPRMSETSARMPAPLRPAPQNTAPEPEGEEQFYLEPLE